MGSSLVDNAELDPVILAHELDAAWQIVRDRDDELERLRRQMRLVSRSERRWRMSFSPVRRAVSADKPDPAVIVQAAIEATAEYNRKVEEGTG